jgi:hypothetical protein
MRLQQMVGWISFWLFRRDLLLGSTGYHRAEELRDELRDPVALR